jgi:hypothetical protein
MKETGMSFCGVLFLIFFVLKLAKVITWSWWWVTAPLWMPTAIVLALIVLAWLIVVFFK